MAEREPGTVRMDQDKWERVERFQRQHGYTDQSEALRQLIDIGLREGTSPLLYRFKDQVVDYVGMLGIMAVIVMLAGFLTPALAAGSAAKLSIALVLTAAMLLGVLELVRFVGGHNVLGARLREIVAEVRRV